jgi:integrase/exonuclease VII small subunit
MENEPVGMGFLKNYSSQVTVSVYRSAIKDFLGFIYKAVDNGDLEQKARQYFREGRDYQKDVELYFQSKKNEAPKSRRLRVSVLRVFLLENGVELPALFWRRLRDRIKGSRALTMDRPPTTEELRKILNLMDIKGKALFLVLASSGMRIGEALKLKVEDFELDKDPARVNVRGAYTKTGNSRVAFISSEAKEAVEQWLRIRGDYLKQASGRSWKYSKPTEDPRMFPFDIPTAYTMWKNALDKAGLIQKDSQTNRLILHPHCLRKFFRSKLAQVIPVDIVESMMGHEGYLVEAYRKYSQEDLADFYKKGEHTLLVFGNGKDLAKLRLEVEEKNKQLQQIINGLVSENLQLKERIKKLEDGFKEIQELKKALEEALGKTS